MAYMQTTDRPIPRGNTAPGVNREIIKYLQTAEATGGGFTELDIPCGNGEFLDTLMGFIPDARVTGSDIKTPPGDFKHQFVQFDASGNLEFPTSEQFDLITCISGVMEFDNTSSFLSKLQEV